MYKPINHTSMKYYKLLTFTLLFCLSACGGEKKDTDTTQDSVETVLPDEANEVTIMTLAKEMRIMTIDFQSALWIRVAMPA